MRKAKYIQILRATGREFEGELWAFSPGDEVAVGGLDMLEDPPTVPLKMALDLIRARDAEALSVRDVGADLELVGAKDPDFDDDADADREAA